MDKGSFFCYHIYMLTHNIGTVYNISLLNYLCKEKYCISFNMSFDLIRFPLLSQLHLIQELMVGMSIQ